MEIWIHRNFQYRRQLGAAAEVIGNHPILCVVAGVGMAMLGMWWSHAEEPQEAIDWLARQCNEPIVLLGDGPMVRRRETAAVYETEFARRRFAQNHHQVTEFPA